jgi:uncharacterized protein (DUF952 family)
MVCVEGFIHLSTGEQLPRTLAQFFKGETSVWVFAIPRTSKIEKFLEVRSLIAW